MPRLTEEQRNRINEMRGQAHEHATRLEKVKVLEKAVFGACTKALPEDERARVRQRRQTIGGRLDIKERAERLVSEGVDEFYDRIEREILDELTGRHRL